ncbi:MAG: hypothetical protein Q8K86_04565 [Candidatus Nanopelagicaceae bacterium]|nr:hypothetical protein [Candidatus Nanopelagicaceae bacterium]
MPSRSHRIRLFLVSTLAFTLSVSFFTPFSFADTPAPVLVKVVDPTGNSRLTNFTVVGSHFYFFATDPAAKKNELWVSDGTAAGTQLVKNVDPTGNLKLVPFAVLGSKFLFVVSDENVKSNTLGITYKLWVSDGTQDGTQLLRSINLPRWRSWFDGITVAGFDVYFFVTSPSESEGGATHGTELWTTNGTVTGTQMIKNINPTNSYCCADRAVGKDFFIALGLKLMFSATDGTHGNELWVSNGIEEGTQASKVINPDVTKSITYGAEVVGLRFYFDVSDGSFANQLWMSNGNAGEERLLKKINLKGNADFGNFKALGSKLFFSANDGAHGNELWSSGGRPSSTKLIKNINPKGDSNIGNTGTWGAKLFFTANDGTHGNELWTSDGTTAGTRMMKDINPKGDSGVREATVVGRNLYFVADDGTHGSEMWVSNGTLKGTHLVKDLNPKGSSAISKITAANSIAYFFTDANSESSTFWSTDGTSTGTRPVESTTVIGEEIFDETVLGSVMYFGLKDIKHRIGLWKITN